MLQLDTRELRAWMVRHDPLSVVAAPVPSRLGTHPVGGRYVEACWLPILGPSALWVLRRLSAWLAVSPEGVEVSLAELSRSIGLGAATGGHSPMVRTLVRLVEFGAASIDGDRLGVFTALPALSSRQLHRLPPGLRACHDDALAVTR